MQKLDFQNRKWVGDVLRRAIQGMILLGIILPRAQSQEIPAGFNVDRYTMVWERNPFVLEKETAPRPHHSAFENLYLTSWLIDGGKEIVCVENAETKEAQMVRAEPNQNNLRLIAMHLSPNPQFVEAVIFDGQEQGTVKFRYDGQLSGSMEAALTQATGASGQGQNLAVTNSKTDARLSGLNRPPGSRLYPGLPRVHWEGGKPGASAYAGGQAKKHFVRADTPKDRE